MWRKWIYSLWRLNPQYIALCICIWLFSVIYFVFYWNAQEVGSWDLSGSPQTELSSDSLIQAVQVDSGTSAVNTIPIVDSWTTDITLLSGSIIGSWDTSAVSWDILAGSWDISSSWINTLTWDWNILSWSTTWILLSWSDPSNTWIFLSWSENASGSFVMNNWEQLSWTENLHPVSDSSWVVWSWSNWTGIRWLDWGIWTMTGESIEFMQPRELMQYVQRWLIVWSWSSSALFWYNFVYRSFDNLIRVSLDSGLVVSTFSWESFDLPSFWIYDSSDYSWWLQLDNWGKSPNDWKEWFWFWVSHQRLVFSKPVRIEYVSEQEDGTMVEVTVKHSWELDYWTWGLGTINNNECLTWWEILYQNNVVRVSWWKIIFYTCWASSFALTYTWWAIAANYVDNWSNTKTVTFLTWTHLPTWAQISDVNLTLSFRPIDSENPASYWTTNCYPTEKSFQLIAPDWTTTQIINPWQLTAPNRFCPTSTIMFDQQAWTALWNNYNVAWSFRPFWNLSTLNWKSPFWVWTLRMTDNALYDWVILFWFTISINATDPFICIWTPATFSTWIVTSWSSQIINYLFDYFSVNDQKWINSWYYTTLSMTSLSWVNWVIPNSLIRWKADPLVLLNWAANTWVLLWWAISTWYIAANTTVTHIYRNAWINNFVKSNYWSKLNLQVTIPWYSPVGLYTWTITYTLYEN